MSDLDPTSFKSWNQEMLDAGHTQEEIDAAVANAADSDDDEQECQNCFRKFPPDDPMLSVADAGDFCSWECVANYASEQTHCWTHDDYVSAVHGFMDRIARIMAKSEVTE